MMSGMFGGHILSWMIAIPFLGIAVLAFVQDQEWIRRTALAATLLDLGICLMLWSGFDFRHHDM